MTKCGCCNIVRQIRHQLIGGLAKNLNWIKKEQVACHQFNIGVLLRCLRQQCQHIALKFNRDNAPRTLRQFSRQYTGTRPNFQYLIALSNFSRLHNAQQHRAIYQKILPERLIGAHIMRIKQVAQLPNIGQINHIYHRLCFRGALWVSYGFSVVIQSFYLSPKMCFNV